MPEYKLVYFDARGKGEFIRYLFAYAKTPYINEEVKIDHYHTEWPKIKSAFPFEQVPVLFVDGKVLAQSRSIGRYLAREFGIEGKTSWDKAKADMLVDGVADAMSASAYYAVIDAVCGVGDTKLVDAWESYRESIGLTFLKRYSAFLKENGHEFFVGDSLTWADFAIAEFVDRLEVCYEPDILHDYPELKHHRNMVHTLDGVAAYIAKRPKLPF